MSSNNESEDLAAFFAKKKAKDGKKKKVVNIDEVGAQLERKAKIQVCALCIKSKLPSF